jgi:signal transduction histidine kinase
VPALMCGSGPPDTMWFMNRDRAGAASQWLLVAVAVALVAGPAGLILCGRYWTHGADWDVATVVLVVVMWLGNVLGFTIGLWWWWRAPANPTGRLLYLAALGDTVYVIGRCWPRSAWATELEWASVFIVPSLALVVLGWPTGRPGRRVVAAVAGSAVGVALIELAGGVFSRTPNPSAEWPDPPEAQFTVPSVYHLLDPIAALLLQAVPAAVVIVVLVRRRHSVPAAVRPLVTPITVAGVIAAAGLIVVHVGFQLFGGPLGLDDGLTLRVMFVLVGDYAMVGLVAIGVFVGATRRRRAAELGLRRIVVDLGSATPVVSPSVAAAATVGDPSARVVYAQAGGTWIDSTGAPARDPDGERVRLPVFDSEGEITAALEVRAATPLPPLLADLALGTIAARAANERATALAEARRTEVRARSRELVAATDEGRRQLERNLHDGAQQLLVGLSLSAGLAARTESADAPGAMITHIAQVRREILELLDAEPPAVLAGGLSGALRTLAATCPVPVVYESSGDLAATDPLALTLYLVAGEAVTNAVKHAAPTAIRLDLTVTADQVRLAIIDDGCGGQRDVAPSITRRVDGVGVARLERSVGRGSAVAVQILRPAAVPVGAAI